jgi:hypothetical protein
MRVVCVQVDPGMDEWALYGLYTAISYAKGRARVYNGGYQIVIHQASHPLYKTAWIGYHIFGEAWFIEVPE